MQYKEGKNTKTAKNVSVRQKIYEIILRIPRETSEVRAELEMLGISQAKIKRWRKNPYSTISNADLVVLMNYFSQYPEAKVSKIDDLMEFTEQENLPKTHKMKDYE